MQSTKLPASMADVAGPLDEAAAYESLQWSRRRGAYGGLVGLLLLALGFGKFVRGLHWPLLVAMAAMFGVVALLFLVRRRPAWKGVFVQTDRDLLQLAVPATSRWPKWLRLAVLFVVVFVTISLRDLGPLPEAVWTGATILLYSAISAVGLRAIKVRALLVGTAVAIAATLPFLLGVLQTTSMLGAWFLAIGTVWLAVAVVRSFAPRRWLVP